MNDLSFDHAFVDACKEVVNYYLHNEILAADENELFADDAVAGSDVVDYSNIFVLA